jgi:hypothetical protein
MSRPGQAEARSTQPLASRPFQHREESDMAFPEPIKPLGQKEAKRFQRQLKDFKLSQERREHFRRLLQDARGN